MIGVGIPSIPPRSDLLGRALTSVLAQTLPADAISVVIDHAGDGAAETRNRAWRSLDTDWVAFLDDDDEFGPRHLEKLHACAVETDADMVYPWFEVVGGTDPFPHYFGQTWDPEHPIQTTITCLWRRTALEKIGGFPPHSRRVDAEGNGMGEDFLAVKTLSDMGGRVVHLPERTWRWHHHSNNTMGLPDRWFAK